jgi:hypothetical protein
MVRGLVKAAIFPCYYLVPPTVFVKFNDNRYGDSISNHKIGAFVEIQENGQKPLRTGHALIPPVPLVVFAVLSLSPPAINTSQALLFAFASVVEDQ